jgi:hypothetical protein
MKLDDIVSMRLAGVLDSSEGVVDELIIENDGSIKFKFK